MRNFGHTIQWQSVGSIVGENETNETFFNISKKKRKKKSGLEYHKGY